MSGEKPDAKAGNAGKSIDRMLAVTRSSDLKFYQKALTWVSCLSVLRMYRSRDEASRVFVYFSDDRITLPHPG